jgi:hypothetical protein
MAYFVNEQKMVEDSTFQFENRIKSPTARFLDTTPTFTTYYHIVNDKTTVDEGFKDVASIVGHRSPIRFDKIEDFPIYGLEQIVLQLQEEDQGLDSSYESEAVILPRTIQPVPNDFFIIPILKDLYMFRVTNIHYDTVMPDNFYKIEFKLEYIDSVKMEELEKQTTSENVCVLENIGTESSCIIEKGAFKKIQQIEVMYREIVEFYKAMFYNDRHNVFLCETENGRFLYDPLQTEFINKHRLFSDKNNLETLILTDEYEDPKRKYKYAKSVYRFIELCDMKLLTTFPYAIRPGTTLHESSFYRWHDKKIDVLDILTIMGDDNPRIFSEEYKTSIEMNFEVESEYARLIQKFVRSEKLTVKDIPLNLDTELIYLNKSLEVFFFTPIIMYIIKEIIKKEL